MHEFLHVFLLFLGVTGFLWCGGFILCVFANPVSRQPADHTPAAVPAQARQTGPGRGFLNGLVLVVRITVFAWGSAFLGVVLVGLVFAAVVLAWPGLFRAGYVETPPAGEAWQLTGVPGDEITLELPLPEGASLDERGLSVTLHDPEWDFTARLALKVRVGPDEDTPEGFYGSFRVPSVPAQPRVNLEGTLEGSYRVRGGGREVLVMPLRLQIARRGEAATSGFEDVPWPFGRIWVALILVVCWYLCMVALRAVVPRCFHDVALVTRALEPLARAVTGAPAASAAEPQAAASEGGDAPTASPPTQAGWLGEKPGTPGFHGTRISQ